MKRTLLLFIVLNSLFINVNSQVVIETTKIPTTSKGFTIEQNTDTLWGFYDSNLKLPDGRSVDVKSLGDSPESVAKTVYVSKYVGDDSNTGTSWSDSYYSFDSAIASIGNLLNVTITVQLDSGIYLCSKESARALMTMRLNANVDIYPVGMTDTLTTLTDVTQDNDTLFKYYVSNTLTVNELDSAYIEGSFRLPIHSNGTNYVIVSTAESAGVGTVVTKNKTVLKFNDSDHIVLNYLSNYSRGGITFSNLKISPLGNKALRLAAFGASKLKFDGCDIIALNVQNNNVIINQCHLYNTQRGIVLNNYDSFIEQCIIEGPGKTSGKSCFDLQNGTINIDNTIIDGFGQVFQNSQGIANISFYDNSSDLFVMNCSKVFSANDGFYLGSGDLNSLVIDNVDYVYQTISDKNVHIILDTATIVGEPVTDYVEDDNNVRIKPENNYIAYVDGIHNESKLKVMLESDIADSVESRLFRNVGYEDFVFRRYFVDKFMEWGTGLDNDFDFKMYSDYDYNEAFGLGIGYQGTSSSLYMHTNGGLVDLTTNVDIDGHLLIESDDTLYIGSKTDNPAYFLKPTGTTEYTSWKSTDTPDYIQLGGEGVGQINIYSPNLYLSSNNGGYLSLIGNSIDTRVTSFEWRNTSNTSVAILNTNSRIFTIKEINTDTTSSTKAHFDTANVDRLETLEIDNNDDTAIVVKKSIYTEVDTIPYASTIEIDCNKSNAFYIDVTGDITSLDIKNVAPGGTYMIGLKQDTGGGNAITLSANFNGQASSHVAFDDTGDVLNLLQVFSLTGEDVNYSNTPIN